jgi:type I site-specific restriction-modification system R (restriction) subunit
MESPSIAHLAPWQISFVDGFVTQKHSKSLLVAAAGTGKTMTALVEAEKMLATNAIDSVMVISDRVVIRDQWSHVAASRGLKLTSSLENHLSSQGVSTTIQALSNADDAAPVEAALRAKRWLVIVDEPHRTITSATHLVC